MLPGGCTKGELTLLGQQQALDVGAWLRHRYVEQLGFLPVNASAGAVSGKCIVRVGLLSFLILHTTQRLSSVVLCSALSRPTAN